MKKITALLYALLLLAVSCAYAETGPVVEFRDRIQLEGSLPDGYSYSLREQTELTLKGVIESGDSSAPALEIFIGFNDSFAEVESLDNLDRESLESVKRGFSEEDDVAFDVYTTSPGDKLLVVRENNGRFLDLYTVCLGYEIELTLYPADGQSLTDAQISRFLELIRTMDIVPVRG